MANQQSFIQSPILQSIRTILEIVIASMLVWVIGSVSELGRTNAALGEKVTAVRDDMTQLQNQLSAIPTLSQSLARIEVKLDEHERRISRMENGGK
jgi:hypothetical protein